MFAESPSLMFDTDALQETMGQICAGHASLEGFVQEIFANLDTLAAEATRQAQMMAGQRQSAEAEFTLREERLGREREELESTFQRIRELTDQLMAPAIAASEGGESFQEMLAGLEKERTALFAALETAEARNAQLSQMAEELAAARRDLAETRDEIRAQRELLSTPSAGSAASHEFQERLSQLEQERGAWAQERAVLETELDAVRNRAAELSDALEEERRRTAEERREWSEELRRMRRLLESLSERPVPTGMQPEIAAAPPVRQAGLAALAAEEPAPANDPVLDSVMAQFEILQKDLARRRKARPTVQPVQPGT